MTLVDTNVVLDVLASEPVWLDWSAGRLAQCRERGPLLINEIIYAELSVWLDPEADLQRVLASLGIQMERTPIPALHAAARAFRRYRAAGGPRTNLLPDFFIGAHAEVLECAILTRDPRRFRAYFSSVLLITPEDP